MSEKQESVFFFCGFCCVPLMENVKKETMQQEWEHGCAVSRCGTACGRWPLGSGSQGFDAEPSGAPPGNQQPVGSNCRVLGRAVQVLGARLPEVKVPVDDCVHFGLCNLLIALCLDRRCFVAGHDAVEQFFLGG